VPNATKLINSHVQKSVEIIPKICQIRQIYQICQIEK